MFVAVLAVRELGGFLLGASAGLLAANLMLRLLPLPANLLPHAPLINFLVLSTAAILLGLLSLSFLPYFVRLCSALVGGFLLSAALSRLMFRLGLALTNPLDPPIFFSQRPQPSPPPVSTLNDGQSNYLVQATLIAFWLVSSLIGMLVQYHNDPHSVTVTRLYSGGTGHEIHTAADDYYYDDLPPTHHTTTSTTRPRQNINSYGQHNSYHLNSTLLDSTLHAFICFISLIHSIPTHRTPDTQCRNSNSNSNSNRTHKQICHSLPSSLLFSSLLSSLFCYSISAGFGSVQLGSANSVKL